MSIPRALPAVSVACLVAVLGLAGCRGGGDSVAPNLGTIAIEIEPDECLHTWTVESGGRTFTGSGDSTLVGVPAGVTWVVHVDAAPGWVVLGEDTATFKLPTGGIQVVQFGFASLQLGAFVPVPAGTFTMGSPVDQPGAHEDEHPRHEVTFTRALLVKATEVTQAEYFAIMKDSPSRNGDCDECPVEQVGLLDVVEFCNRLSAWDGLEPPYTVVDDSVFCDWDADGYRLPTESEWEYFCRAGTTTRFSFGDDPTDLAAYGWVGAGTYGDTHPVAQKLANPWGLYDCHGNVFEMTWDGYFWYPDQPVTDPRRDPHNENRMARGGDFHSGWEWATSTWRGTYTANDRLQNLGFRIVRYAPGAKDAAGGVGPAGHFAAPSPGRDKAIGR